MKRAVIVHCWGGNPEYAWYPWLKTALEKRGYSVIVPFMPDTDAPQLSTWLPTLQKAIEQPDDELLLIGHSLGCATIMRYLETLGKEEFVGQAIFVAGFAGSVGLAPIDNFFVEPIDLAAITNKSIHGYGVIQSDDDPYVPMTMALQLRDELAASLVIMHAAGHMSGPVDDEEGCHELPQVLDFLV